MRSLDYDMKGFSTEARALIDQGVPFQIVVGGWKAKLLRPLIPEAGIAISGTTAAAIVAIAALSVLAAVMLYAIKNGMEVEGEVEGSKGPIKGKIKIRVKKRNL